MGGPALNYKSLFKHLDTKPPWAFPGEGTNELSAVSQL